MRSCRNGVPRIFLLLIAITLQLLLVGFVFVAVAFFTPIFYLLFFFFYTCILRLYFVFSFIVN